MYFFTLVSTGSRCLFHTRKHGFFAFVLTPSSARLLIFVFFSCDRLAIPRDICRPPRRLLPLRGVSGPSACGGEEKRVSIVPDGSDRCGGRGLLPIRPRQRGDQRLAFGQEVAPD